MHLLADKGHVEAPAITNKRWNDINHTLPIISKRVLCTVLAAFCLPIIIKHRLLSTSQPVVVKVAPTVCRGGRSDWAAAVAGAGRTRRLTATMAKQEPRNGFVVSVILLLAALGWAKVNICYWNLDYLILIHFYIRWNENAVTTYLLHTIIIITWMIISVG